LRILRVLIEKDFKCLLRRRETLTATIGFALILVVIASFSFRTIGYGEEELRVITPGVLWLVFIFFAVIGLNYTFAPEQDDRAIAGVLMSPIDPTLVFISKFIVNFIFLFSVQCGAILLHELFFGANISFAFGQIVFITFLGVLGFVAIGTLLSSISTAVRVRDVLLPLLLFPLSLPLIAGLVSITRTVLETGSIPYSSFWFSLILAYDVIALVLSWSLFEFCVIE